MPQLEQGQTIERPWIGVSTSPALGGGAEVAEVVPGSPADRAGLENGDVIVGVGGDRVAEPDDVAGAISSRQPGDRVSVEVRGGGGGTRDVEIELGTRPR